MKNLFKSTAAKVSVGFILGVSTVGGVASAAGVFGGNVTNACVDNKTNAIYASLNGTCSASRTAVTLGSSTSSDLPAVTSIKSIVAKVSPSVVTVNVTAGGNSDTGSGSIYKSDATSSYIVTNNHVIASAIGGAGTIEVELDNGDSVPATIVGADSNYDLAVLKIARGNQPAIQIGNSSTLNIGDSVIAFGSPLGLDHTVTAGIVSSLNRPVTTGTTGTESYVDAIQTDAAINPGNSGGPLTDSLGQMVGINSAIATLGSSFSGQSGSIGVGFSIPISEAQRVINEIIANGKATRPVLGVYFDTTYTGKGAKISGLTANDAAQKAGIPSGSIVTAIDGIKIPDSVTAIVRIRAHAPGDSVSVTVTLPTGGSKTFTATLGSATTN